MANINYIEIIKNSIHIYKSKYKQFAVPIYLAYLISFVLDMLTKNIGTIAGTAIIALSLNPIYAALKKKKIPSWKNNYNEYLKKGLIYSVVKFISALILVVLFFCFLVCLIIIIAIIGLILFLILSTVVQLLNLNEILILITVIVFVLLFLVLAIICSVFITIIYSSILDFTYYNYIIKNIKIIKSIKRAYRTVSTNFKDVFIFYLLLDIIRSVLLLIPILFIIVILIIVIPMLFFLGPLLLILVFIPVIMLLALYEMILIKPWCIVSTVDLWDKLDTDKKKK